MAWRWPDVGQVKPWGSLLLAGLLHPTAWMLEQLQGSSTCTHSVPGPLVYCHTFLHSSLCHVPMFTSSASTLAQEAVLKCPRGSSVSHIQPSGTAGLVGCPVSSSRSSYRVSTFRSVRLTDTSRYRQKLTLHEHIQAGRGRMGRVKGI